MPGKSNHNVEIGEVVRRDQSRMSDVGSWHLRRGNLQHLQVSETLLCGKVTQAQN